MTDSAVYKDARNAYQPQTNTQQIANNSNIYLLIGESGYKWFSPWVIADTAIYTYDSNNNPISYLSQFLDYDTYSFVNFFSKFCSEDHFFIKIIENIICIEIVKNQQAFIF